MQKNTILLSIFVINLTILIPITVYLTASLFQTSQSMWKYQCIDTMKVSRDEARTLENDHHAQQEIAQQMKEIKALGANCVAIDTPYDDEFIPILSLWVNEARKQQLHIWFRGNFSSWEGWFDYPKGMTTLDLLNKTKVFILNHQELFANGDVFTPAPEAENGWPGNYVPQEDYPIFRQFLIDEYITTQNTFIGLHKHVDTWLSMNGGLARSMMDYDTIKATGNKVTIDHYVESPQEMNDYITYFSKTFGAQVIIGEFGAPIPDINGEMTDQEQAQFVNSVFYEIYKNKQNVYAVNYWVLAGGTTSLVGSNFEEKPVAKIIRTYFKPTLISGKIKDELGNPVSNVIISTDDNAQVTMSSSQGNYTLVSPNKPLQVAVVKDGYIRLHDTIPGTESGTIIRNITIQPSNPDSFYLFKLMLVNSFKRIHIIFSLH